MRLTAHGAAWGREGIGPVPGPRLAASDAGWRSAGSTIPEDTEAEVLL